MSRIGREPIHIPAGVTVDVKDNRFTVKGPLGTLTQEYDPLITVKEEGSIIHLTRANEEKATKAKHGLYRMLLNNMIVGVTKGYSKNLVIAGVGYKVAKQGKKIVLNVGYSHAIEVEEIPGITLECPSQTEILVKGIDKCVVGQIAANIRMIRKPEPYHGYGIHYSDEVIEHKEGKTAGK